MSEVVVVVVVDRVSSTTDGEADMVTEEVELPLLMLLFPLLLLLATASSPEVFPVLLFGSSCDAIGLGTGGADGFVFVSCCCW